MLFAPDYRTVKGGAGPGQAAKAGPVATLRYIFGNRTLLLIYAVQLASCFYIGAGGTWFTSYYMRTFNLNVAEASRYIGIIGICGAFGPPAAGWLSDRLFRKGPAGRFRVEMALFAVLALCHSIVYLGPLAGVSLGWTIVAAGIAQFCQAAQWGVLIAACLDFIPTAYRGTSMGFIPLFQSIPSFFAGGVAGWFSDRWGLPVAMEIMLVLGLGSACLCLRLAQRSYLADCCRHKPLGDAAVEKVR
jgi:sugar phosphate permease